MKRHVPLGLLALLICTTFLLIMAISRGRSPMIHEASLVFLGFTNVPTHGEGAHLCCSNGSSTRISFSVESFDTFSSGSWETHRLDNGDRRGGLTDEAKGWLDRFISTPSRFDPKEAATFYVPLPATNTMWRVRFSCVEQTLGDKIRKHTIGGAELPPHAVMVNGDYFTGRRYNLLSREISK
ncbi:MAG: hypothetical protein NT154_20635 [Verrucomicrobia bacterium]|nr:hypothetical protein [Verrucomicrobiota bacterium]